MIYLLFLCLTASLVSANSLAKLLLQTKSNCNHNGFKNMACNVPIQANNNQPYVPPITIQNPLNSCPCNQPYGLQNAPPVPVRIEDKNQSYFNKILANPMFKNILSSNNNQNNNNLPQANPEPSPNIVNNYYIIPPECFNGNDGVEVVKNLIGNQAVCQTKRIQNQKDAENNNRNTRQSDRQNKDNRTLNSKSKAHNNSGDIRNQNSKRKNRRGRNEKHNISQHNNHDRIQNMPSKNAKVNDVRDLSNKQNDSRSNPNVRKNGHKKRKKQKNIDHIPDSQFSVKNDSLLNELSEEAKSKEKKKQNDMSISPRDEDIKQIKSRKSRDEDVIKDIHEKFPGIPEDVIKLLLRYLRRQMRNRKLQQTRDSNKNRVIHNNEQGENDKTKQNKRIQNKNSTDLVDVIESILPATTDKSLDIKSHTTTENVLQKEVSTTYEENNMKNTTPHNIKTEVIEMTTNKLVQSSQPETQDSESDLDDYFPDFRFDNMYMSEDDYVRSLRDNRFYYTTDRNYDHKKYSNKDKSSEIYYEPFKPATAVKKNHDYTASTISEIHSDEIEDTLISPDKDYENYDEEMMENYSSEDIQFKTPPILEHPDFETKPIIKYLDEKRPVYNQENKNMDSFSEKSSTYSNVKSISTPLKKTKNDNIETVFARTKVVKYGQPQDFEDIFDKTEDPKHDDTVVVYARSMDS